MRVKITRHLIALVMYLFFNPPVQAQADEKTWLLNQINNLRVQHNLHAYSWNAQLAAAAQQHSEYMAATGDISHQESNGSMAADRAAANGYTGDWIMENIYGGYQASANDAWTFWTNSAIHYNGLVHQQVNEIGIGIASDGTGRYFTLVFGRGGSGINLPPSNPPVTPVSTRRPLPPTPTTTPSPTVPTFTPTVTWTFTPTWTPTPSSTPPPNTPTPIKLPTAAIVVAQEVTPDASRSIVPPTVEDDTDLQDFLPYLVVGQVILIGVAILSIIFRRKD